MIFPAKIFIRRNCQKSCHQDYLFESVRLRYYSLIDSDIMSGKYF